MAKINYEHIFAAAGFSGENWDVCVGHNLSFDSSGDALDVTFDVAKTITLAAGSFPAWMQIVGTVFSTDSVTNAGPFTVVSASASVITVAEAVAAEAGVDVVFDGSADTDIQDVLLSVGAGALTEDAPHVIVSSGALGAARQLDISAMEVESAALGSMPLDGRFFYLSVQNSDILTNNLTVVSSSTINGAASLVISSEGDYMFHHVSGGVWLVNILPRPSEKLATLARVDFLDSDWAAGTANQIKVIQTGTPGAGEVGPHLISAADTYLIQVFNTDLGTNEIVDAEIQVDSNGDILIYKAGLGQAFNGTVVISGTLD